MKQKIEKYLFAQPSGLHILKYVSRINDDHVVLCFDLEDIVKDLTGQNENNSELNLQREAVVETLNVLNAFPDFIRVGIRVNSFESLEFFEDIKMLAGLAHEVKLSCLFLPKVETGEEIINCTEFLTKQKITFGEVIPIIESNKGYKNVLKILATATPYISKFAFGHCDLNYDLQNFPFYHQQSYEYWKWILRFAEAARKYDKLLINSPYLLLNDDEGFLQNLKKLHENVNSNVGQVVFTLNQIALASSFEKESVSSVLFPMENLSNGKSKIEFAKTIIADFEENKIFNKSFSLNAKKRSMISPHEYLAAKNYVDSISTSNE